MDIEKLIERLRTDSLYADKATLEIMDLCMEAADALSTLQAENEKLLAELDDLRIQWDMYGGGMKEYIEKADAINLLWLFADESCASVVSDFEGLPAADIAEVRHAFWSDYGSGVCCTNCGVSLFHQDENNNWGIEPSKFMFCPSCGALMDEEADHETS